MLRNPNGALYSLISTIQTNTATIINPYLHDIKTVLLSYYDYFDYYVEQFDSVVDSLVNLPDTLHDMLYELYEEINDEFNPMSENNSADFSAALSDLHDDTFIGSVTDLSDSGSQLTTALGNVSPNSHLYVNLIPVSFYGATVGAQQIDIDMSWYGAYRTQTFSILRAFMYLGYFILVLRSLPSLLGGTSPVVDNILRPDIVEFENITVDDDGVVFRHSTTSVDRQGNRTTQVHRGKLD